MVKALGRWSTSNDKLRSSRLCYLDFSSTNSWERKVSIVSPWCALFQGFFQVPRSCRGEQGRKSGQNVVSCEPGHRPKSPLMVNRGWWWRMVQLWLRIVRLMLENRLKKLPVMVNETSCWLMIFDFAWSMTNRLQLMLDDAWWRLIVVNDGLSCSRDIY